MGIMKTILTIAITLTIAIAVITTTRSITTPEDTPRFKNVSSKNIQSDRFVVPQKRMSRFLQETTKPRNPNAADHCLKDNEVCSIQDALNSNLKSNTTCCNNKCIDLKYDNKNCGACKNKCKFTQACCRGQCVYLSFDKRHCGACNNRCPTGDYCVYGMCNYA